MGRATLIIFANLGKAAPPVGTSIGAQGQGLTSNPSSIRGGLGPLHRVRHTWRTPHPEGSPDICDWGRGTQFGISEPLNPVQNVGSSPLLHSCVCPYLTQSYGSLGQNAWREKFHICFGKSLHILLLGEYDSPWEKPMNTFCFAQ